MRNPLRVKIDLHVHSFYSLDSSIPVKRLAKLIKLKNLDGIALTDHDTMRGVPQAKELLEKAHLIFIPGVEISTPLGHVVGLFISEVPPQKTLPDALDNIKSQGGISIAPHPFDTSLRKSLGKKIFNFKFDGMEIFSSRCILRKSDLLAKQVCKDLDLIGIATSDAHSWTELGNSYVEMDAQTSDEVLLCLRRKKFLIYGSYSPLRVHLRSHFSKFLRLVKF
jgi:hypothetical protein